MTEQPREWIRRFLETSERGNGIGVSPLAGKDDPHNKLGQLAEFAIE